MPLTQKCPQCGAEMTTDAPQGLCPACLLKGGLAISTGPANGETIPADATPLTMVRRQPVPGETFGSYRVLRRLGGGGMGEVFEAEQTDTGRRVAIKVLKQAIGSDADRKRFIREGRMAATISDPHVVYVFGSEEIDGAPVIAMELAGSGTLSERVKKGQPLPPAEAVDDILQVIDGLDAAQAAGVLHRDIKPSNCFVDRDGTVKVGDFGLSISTLGHIESQNITMPGSLLGTPAFASPEQLRGSQLDVRADIYSVGATLYFLLTGKPPHEAEAIVALITAVLDKVPASPRTLQPKIPQGLANVVMKCLAKDPKARFANYAQLRRALQPFCSAAPTPGTLGLRFVAGLVDTFIASVPSLAFAVVAGFEFAPINLLAANPSLRHLLQWCAFALFETLYFAIPEGLWGASLGKWICRLRVIGPDRQVSGIPRALLRALMFNFLYGWLPYFIEMGWRLHKESGQYPTTFGFPTAFADAGAMIFWALIFVTARRTNGFAGLHELLSSTRVIAVRDRQARPVLAGAASPKTPERVSDNTPHLGPYAILETIAKTGGSDWLLGRDEVLRRNVWLLNQTAGTPPVAPSRRDLARPGRVRWLNGRRTGNETWDAYEAPSGKPLTALAATKQSWAAVRFWLLDLAEEISAGLKDGSLPPLTLANVWITTSGRALLLDVGTSSSLETPALPDIQKFLSDVATAALGPEPQGLPLQVAPFLGNLRERSLHAMEFVVANLQSFTEKIPAVSRGRRAASLFLAPACFVAIAIFTTIAMGVQKRAQDKLPGARDPKITEFRQVLAGYSNFLTETNMEVAQGVKIAAKYGDLINDPKFWETYGETMKRASPDARKLAEQAVARYSQPTADQKKISDSMALFTTNAMDAIQDKMFSLIGVFAFVGFTGFMAIFNFIFCIVGIPVGLQLFGIAIVDKNGRPASRWRLVGRWLLAWILPLCLWVTVQVFVVMLHRTLSLPLTVTVSSIVGILWLIGIAVAIRNPARGPQDRLAGTWLVPR